MNQILSLWSAVENSVHFELELGIDFRKKIIFFWSSLSPGNKECGVISIGNLMV